MTEQEKKAAQARHQIIKAIYERQLIALSLLADDGVAANPPTFIDFEMDMESVHEEFGCDLKFLLEADDVTFGHDVSGILTNMNRDIYPGTLGGCFLPRFVRKSYQPPAPVEDEPVLTTTRKIGSNRTKARLWIEGVVLQSMGWAKGKRFVTLWEGGSRTLTYCSNTPSGKGLRERKVAGTPDRPIIDTNTDALLSILDVEVGGKVHITITKDTVTVVAYNPAVHDTEHATDGERA